MSGVKQFSASILSKKIITQAFEQAVDTYDHSALGQQQTIEFLWQDGYQALSQLAQNDDIDILEIGCGTGNLSIKLVYQFQGASMTITDLSPRMLRKAQQKLSDWPYLDFQVMDGEKLTQQGPWDLIISSLAFQWFLVPQRSLSAWCRALKPGGLILLSTMGSDSFQSIRSAQKALQIKSRLRVFPKQQDFSQICAEATQMAEVSGNWQVHEHRFDCDYGSAYALLKSFQQIGAHSADLNVAPMSISQSRHLIRYLDQTKQRRQADFHIFTALFQKQI